MAEDPIIRYADMGDHEEFDEFIAYRPKVMHLERMGDAQWWLGVTTADGREWHINVGAISTRAKGYGNCEEDTSVPSPPKQALAADSAASEPESGPQPGRDPDSATGGTTA